MEMASDLADLLDRPLTENLDHFAFLMLLCILIFLGIREFRKQNIEEGIALIFLPFAYYFFAFFYFLNRSAEGRSDTFVDWRDNWAFGLTQLFSSYNAPITIIEDDGTITKIGTDAVAAVFFELFGMMPEGVAKIDRKVRRKSLEADDEGNDDSRFDSFFG